MQDVRRRAARVAAAPRGIGSAAGFYLILLNIKNFIGFGYGPPAARTIPGVEPRL
jgi:hypothetical protein